MNENVVSEDDKIQSLEEPWKSRFNLLQSIGAREHFIYTAMGGSEYKNLSFKEKQTISFNILAFLFGPLYYFAKKMWVKGALILGGIWMLSALLTLLEAVLGFTLPSVIFWIPSAVFCAQMSSYDYFKKVMDDEIIWNNLPSIFSKPAGFIGLPALAMIFLLIASSLSPEYEEDLSIYTLEEVSGVWRADSDGALVEISLLSDPKFLNINGNQIPVTLETIDSDNDIITVGVTLSDGNRVIWSIRQFFYEDDTFDLDITLHDGTQEALSFVRAL